MACQKENDSDGNGPGSSDPDLFAYFPLDNDYTDASENDNLLEVFGTPEFVEGYGNEPSTAILLDGRNDYLIGHIGLLDTFSISMWAQSYRYYVGEWPQMRSFLFDYSDKQVYGYIDGISGATQINCGIDSEPVAGADIENCTDWFHLYIAFSDDVKIYLNGSLSKTVIYQDAIDYLSDIIYFGRASNDDEIELTYFYGKIDEIRIYNKILDQTEIDELALK